MSWSLVIGSGRVRRYSANRLREDKSGRNVEKVISCTFGFGRLGQVSKYRMRYESRRAGEQCSAIDWKGRVSVYERLLSWDEKKVE